MPFADINGIHYHYERSGSGTPVILVTGLAGDIGFWTRTVPILGGYDVIAVDNRGAGETESSGPFTIEDMADDIAALVRQLGLDRAHILGWSMGSHIALCFASKYPELTRTLTIVSSYLRRPSRSAYILSYLAEGYSNGTVSEETVGTVMNVLLRTESYFRSAEERNRTIHTAKIGSRDGMLFQMKAVDDFDLGDMAHKVKAPALSIHGLEDIMTPPQCGDDMAKEIEGCRIFRAPGEGHVMRPESYIPEFLRFISEN